MGCCAEAKHEDFMGSVPDFEKMRVRSGIRRRMHYLDISQGEQQKRLTDRKTNPRK